RRRGRIEGLTWHRPRRSCGGLHGVAAVAELKARRARDSRCDGSGLHGVAAVAELKGGEMQPPAKLIFGLHGVAAVAELKGLVAGHVARALSVSTASPPWPN